MHNEDKFKTNKKYQQIYSLMYQHDYVQFTHVPVL